MPLASGRLTESPGGQADHSMKGAHEVRQVPEADIERDVGDRGRIVGEPARRVSKTGADQVLMWRDAEHAGEHAQEMEDAEPHLPGHDLEVEGLV